VRSSATVDARATFEVKLGKGGQVEGVRLLSASAGDAGTWARIVASAKVPAPLVAALDEAVRKALDTPEWKKFCAETYTCVERMDHKQSQAFVEKNYREVGAFMKQFGLAK